jgi:hypothetical protein
MQVLLELEWRKLYWSTSPLPEHEAVPAESLRTQVRCIGRTGRILAACGLDRTIVRVRNTLTHSDSLLDPSLHDLA